MQQEQQQSSTQLSNPNLSQEIQKIADNIKADVEKQLNQVFQKFQVVDAQQLPNQTVNEPDRTSYTMKVKTDDDQGHLKLRTSRRDPFSDWFTDIDEVFRWRSPFESMLNTFDPFRTGCSSIQSLADNLKSDVEKYLNRSFDTFDVIEHHPILTDPKHTSYYMSED